PEACEYWLGIRGRESYSEGKFARGVHARVVMVQRLWSGRGGSARQGLSRVAELPQRVKRRRVRTRCEKLPGRERAKRWIPRATACRTPRQRFDAHGREKVASDR